MRFYVVKQDTELKALGQALFKGNRKALSDRLVAANPHVDFGRVEAGAVLLVPDAADAREGEAASVSQAGFERFEREFALALRAAGERIRREAGRRNDSDKEAEKLLKSASMRKLAESDAVVRDGLSSATEYLRSRARETKDADVRLDAIEGGLMEEIGKLQRLLR